MTIVRTDYRRKRPPQREAPVAIPMRIVSARAPKPAAPAVDKPLIERPAQAAAITTPRIVTPTKRSPPRYVPAGSAERSATFDATPVAPPPAERKLAIVTARKPGSGQFGPVQEIDAEEHQRRGDAAVALFREIVGRANATE